MPPQRVNARGRHRRLSPDARSLYPVPCRSFVHSWVDRLARRITTRVTKTGERRFLVRYRLGGRAYPIVHGGTFKTLKEASTRRDLIAGELAAGRNPPTS